MEFAEWYERSDALAAVLVERGVVAGDVVAIMLPSSFGYAIAYGAAALAGAVATGVNTRLGAREIAAIVERADPALILFDAAAFDPAIAPIVDSAPALVLRADGLARWAPGPVSVLGGRSAAAVDAAVIIWTSGTTGVPKGAWFDHRGLHAAVASAGAMSAPVRREAASPHRSRTPATWPSSGTSSRGARRR